MAVLAAGPSFTDTKSVSCLNKIDRNSSQSQQKRYHCQPHSSSNLNRATLATTVTTTNGSREYSANNRTDVKSLKQSATSLNALLPSASAANARSTSPSRKSVNSNGSTTAKHEQSSATAAAAATIATAAANHPMEKEKKRKEVSGSRVKKFHRHFSQVSKDEKLINYFSCALVSDILLQGHLYITDQHFAFYSNVFGYVTKVVIPTSSVTRISKEKTAKIIPNAVGVATADERHVFGSFISREAAFRLMCSVCPPLAPAALLPKTPADILEYSEELSIEDDSSCSVSGNESPSQALIVNNDGQTLMRRAVAGCNSNNKREHFTRQSEISNNVKAAPPTATRASAPPTAHYSTSNGNNSSSSTTNSSNKLTMSALSTLLTTPTPTAAVAGAASSVAASNITMIIAGTASSSTSAASSSPSPSSVSSTTSLPTIMVNTPKAGGAHGAESSFRLPSKKLLLKIKLPKELHVVYVGVLLSIVLALFSGFLLYRILDIEAKTKLYRSPLINWGTVNDDDILAEALRWQRELQEKSAEETQLILNNNLEQIAKVRRSLETLSMLIHDRSSAAGTPANTAETLKCSDND